MICPLYMAPTVMSVIAVFYFVLNKQRKYFQFVDGVWIIESLYFEVSKLIWTVIFVSFVFLSTVETLLFIFFDIMNLLQSYAFINIF